MKKYDIGYTQGVYDMFHIGHLNLLNHAKELCEYLIVGVNADELVQKYKHRKPVINEIDRAEIVRNIKAVDKVVIVHTLDKLKVLDYYRYDAIFIGDDWKGHPRWEKTKKDLQERNIDLVFLPHTKGVSSSELRPIERNKVLE